MFALSPSAKRWIALSAFALFCVGPTAYVAYTAWSIHRPEHAVELAAHLDELLGMKSELGAVSYPRPKVIQYHDLMLKDPELHEPVFTSPRVRLSRAGSGLGIAAEEARLVVAQAAARNEKPILQTALAVPSGETLQSAESATRDARRLSAMVEGLLRRLDSAESGRVELTCPELTVELGRRRYVLHDVVARYLTEKDSPVAAIDFRVAALQMAVPAQLEIRRDRRPGVATTHVVLRTGPTPLPVSLFAPFLDAAEWLGSEARLQGTLWLDEEAEGWDVNVEGRLVEVDLDTLVSRHFPHRLAGVATVEIDRLQWRSGRVHAMRASLRAGPGRVAAGLLQAVAREMGFHLSEQIPFSGDVPYEQLAMTFAVRDGWLQVKGRCTATTADAVIVGPEGTLLFQPSRAVPVVGLVRALVPQSDVLVPANVQSDALLRVLPLPTIGAAEQFDTTIGAKATSSDGGRRSAVPGPAEPARLRVEQAFDIRSQGEQGQQRRR